jgi:hypothetical protein
VFVVARALCLHRSAVHFLPFFGISSRFGQHTQLLVTSAFQLIAPPVILSQTQQMDDGFCQQQEQRRDPQPKQDVFVISESSSSSSSSPVRRVASPALALSASKKGFKVHIANFSLRALRVSHNLPGNFKPSAIWLPATAPVLCFSGCERHLARLIRKITKE